jgi:hypothetical protein
MLYLPRQEKLFAISATRASAFEILRDMLYKYLSYNTQINITCQPKFYLEPNSVIQITDSVHNISGDYNIISYTLPLNY